MNNKIKMTEALLYLALNSDDLSREHQEAINIVVETVGQWTVSPMSYTNIICDKCHAINALGYRLKRSGGKYLALCVDDQGGCAGRDITPQCSFIDITGLQCEQLAEFQIGLSKEINSCVLHTGILLKDREETVYAIR